MKHQNIKNKVEWILREIPESRNSDKVLVHELNLQFYKDSFAQADDGKWWPHPDKYMFLPAVESITRSRRTIQNKEKRYPPTDLVVLAERQRREQIMRKSQGAATDLIA